MLALWVFLFALLVMRLLIIIFPSQAIFVRQQIARTQAYYAAMSAINFAFDQFRQGQWKDNNTYNFCNQINPTCSQFDFPPFIKKIDVIKDGDKVSARVTYDLFD